ncbi:monofunctional biosynthetic peptidoglycan transglycosylase [Candidatus Thiodiazotropha sp. CDECU1]|uniref:monofunctional biosynthetic peptidoglycan transglycosylase n=1 Tax=Candidatus Thiodiazotropha sp. CDECU1 TaxID=3065865 RepID=UPI00292F136C|nr:monofunctional biosynthetic peptidoglycan transglycosylase [Candidatus Thiodiazotropha sp. CDECU1]
MARKPRKKARLSRLYKRLSRWIFLLFIAFFTLLSALLLTLRFVDPPTWSWKLQREFNPPLDHSIESLHVWWDLAYIPAAMQLAVIASEDQNFPNHKGIDFNAVQQVLRDAERGRTLRGASTLTQQTVKNLFLWQRRDWSRKLLEGGLAFLLELMWNKERILEVYLNIVEFGPGVYGVAAASEYWYQLPLDRLTVNQMARLAALLPNPWHYRAEPPTPYIIERAGWIEQQMDQLGYVWLIPVTGE